MQPMLCQYYGQTSILTERMPDNLLFPKPFQAVNQPPSQPSSPKENVKD